MPAPSPKRILFAGYAPVHFLCFLPVYRRLLGDPDIEVSLSGGLRAERNGAEVYDAEAMYRLLPVEHDRVLPFDQACKQQFDVTVCAHTSVGLLPARPGRTVQIFHGVSFKNFAVRQKVLQFDVLCLPGRYHAQRFRDQGLMRDDGTSFLLTGFPKADRLVAEGFDRKALLESLDLDPERPTILFAPTGGKHNAMETAGEEIVDTIERDGRWNLLIKPHDHPKRAIDWVGRLASAESDRVRIVRDLDVVDYLLAADLLVSDASSVAVEYALLDRPIVFIEVPRLLKNVTKRGAPLDLTTYGRRIGRLVGTPAELVREIDEALSHPATESRLRRAMARDVFHLSGGAAERVAGVVRWAAGTAATLPAEVEVLRP